MNRNILAEKSMRAKLYTTALIAVLCVSLSTVLIPMAQAYVSGPASSGTVTDWYGFQNAASYGTLCRYDARSGSTDPYFFPTMESHSWSSPYPVRQIKSLKITVSGTKPNGQPISGLEFTDLAFLDSPHDTGSEWYYTLTDIYNLIVNLLPQPASALLKYGKPEEAGVSYDSTSAWAEWNWLALHPLMYDKGLQFRFKLHCDPGLSGTYTLNIVYHLELYGQNRPSGPGFLVFDNDVATDTLYYYFNTTPPWDGRTIPAGHYYNFYEISTPYGLGYHVDTKGSNDYNYNALGLKLTDYTVGADGNIRVRGYFRQSDTFYSSDQPGRRQVFVYVMYSDNLNTIVKTAQVLDWTDGTDWRYKEVVITGLTAGRSVRIGVGRPDAWSWDWQLVAEWTYVSVISGAGEGVRFNLREHGAYRPSYSPDIRFLKPSSGVLRIDSSQAGPGSLGYGWAFTVVPRDWLNGKYIRFTWSGYYSYYGAVTAAAYIYDGSYDQAVDADFPEGAGIRLKGTGLLQTLAQKYAGGNWGPETVDVRANVAAGTQAKCTIFFYIGDAWIQQTVYLDIDTFGINTGAGGTGAITVERFDTSVVMERTGTYGDYGYIGYGDINP